MNFFPCFIIILIVKWIWGFDNFLESFIFAWDKIQNVFAVRFRKDIELLNVFSLDGYHFQTMSQFSVGTLVSIFRTALVNGFNFWFNFYGWIKWWNTWFFATRGLQQLEILIGRAPGVLKPAQICVFYFCIKQFTWPFLTILTKPFVWFWFPMFQIILTEFIENYCSILFLPLKTLFPGLENPPDGFWHHTDMICDWAGSRDALITYSLFCYEKVRIEINNIKDNFTYIKFKFRILRIIYSTMSVL